jgi:hypothetical protein
MKALITTAQVVLASGIGLFAAHALDRVMG